MKKAAEVIFQCWREAWEMAGGFIIGLLELLIAAVMAITSPVWVIPYAIWRKKKKEASEKCGT